MTAVIRVPMRHTPGSCDQTAQLLQSPHVLMRLTVFTNITPCSASHQTHDAQSRSIKLLWMLKYATNVTHKQTVTHQVCLWAVYSNSQLRHPVSVNTGHFWESHTHTHSLERELIHVVLFHVKLAFGVAQRFGHLWDETLMITTWTHAFITSDFTDSFERNVFRDLSCSMKERNAEHITGADIHTKCVCAEQHQMREKHKVMRRQLSFFNSSGTFLDGVLWVTRVKNAHQVHVYIEKQW